MCLRARDGPAVRSRVQSQGPVTCAPRPAQGWGEPVVRPRFMLKYVDVHGVISDLRYVQSRSMPVREQYPDTVISLDRTSVNSSQHLSHAINMLCSSRRYSFDESWQRRTTDGARPTQPYTALRDDFLQIRRPTTHSFYTGDAGWWRDITARRHGQIIA
jgi:hypothetical protein